MLHLPVCIAVKTPKLRNEHVSMTPVTKQQHSNARSPPRLGSRGTNHHQLAEKGSTAILSSLRLQLDAIDRRFRLRTLWSRVEVRAWRHLQIWSGSMYTFVSVIRSFVAMSIPPDLPSFGVFVDSKSHSSHDTPRQPQAGIDRLTRHPQFTRLLLIRIKTLPWISV